jgi:hypothetical protein
MYLLLYQTHSEKVSLIFVGVFRHSGFYPFKASNTFFPIEILFYLSVFLKVIFKFIFYVKCTDIIAFYLHVCSFIDKNLLSAILCQTLFPVGYSHWEPEVQFS